ncbi:hypothetical protein SCLCIDRAFT_176315 [Scleroderma citrinum Foug A]|uniref:Uncharacterized protein n=1 Tax=Scleroderma citrinum Foug A TaxID=1036808 RepID=A0A0C3EDZ0_9AGAM|nr:hypothetical protein SCLCIDRAFT_176315 [Scleroderma citrinum Foug A]
MWAYMLSAVVGTLSRDPNDTRRSPCCTCVSPSEKTYDTLISVRCHTSLASDGPLMRTSENEEAVDELAFSRGGGSSSCPMKQQMIHSTQEGRLDLLLSCSKHRQQAVDLTMPQSYCSESDGAQCTIRMRHISPSVCRLPH